MAAGIEVRHRAGCKVRPNGSGCSCTPGYRATAFDKVSGKKLARTFPTEGAAKSWRRDVYGQLGRGERTATVERRTLREACDEWFVEARAGVVTTRSGDRYKPRALRAYEAGLRLKIYDVLGDRPLHTIRRSELQRLVDALTLEGCSPSSIQVAVTALRVVFARAAQRDEIEMVPTAGLKLPAVRGRRERIADPLEAAELIAAAPDQHRALWASGFYSGLRRGELLALKWDRVDFAAGTIDVVASWDPDHGTDETKNRQRRRVPMPTDLREHLAAHRLRQAPGIDYVFGTAERPWDPSWVQRQADVAWKAAGLKRLTLHDCRHTYASLMIAAGVNAKALCDFMGHSSITVTFDRYGHLMPGSENEAAGLLDDYLVAARAETAT